MSGHGGKPKSCHENHASKSLPQTRDPTLRYRADKAHKTNFEAVEVSRHNPIIDTASYLNAQHSASKRLERKIISFEHRRNQVTSREKLRVCSSPLMKSLGVVRVVEQRRTEVRLCEDWRRKRWTPEKKAMSRDEFRTETFKPSQNPQVIKWTQYTKQDEHSRPRVLNYHPAYLFYFFIFYKCTPLENYSYMFSLL